MIVLASGSAARHRMLENAGVAFVTETAAVDEGAIKAAMRQETRNPARVAEILAELKATRVSARRPGMLVIGADQMLDLGDRWFDKPATAAEAREQLAELRGQTHRLTSAVVAVRDGRRLWHNTDTARLTMRSFSDAFLDDYFARMGESAATTVGAYQIEGLGAQLFAKIEGDHFTILGMPLLPLLDFLRENGELTR